MRQNRAETAEFLERFKAGDISAFESFCKDYKHVVKAAISNLCRKQDQEDLIQEVFFKLHRIRDRYDPSKSRLSTWVSRISRSIAIDNYRARKCRPQILGHDNFDDTPGVLSSIDLDKSDRLFRHLDKEDMMFIRLKFVENLRYEDIAVATGLHVGSVKSRIFRIRQKIKENYEDGLRSS